MQIAKIGFAIILSAACIGNSVAAGVVIPKDHDLLRKCGIDTNQNRTGKPTFYNKTGAKNSIVEQTLQGLTDIDFRFGHSHTNPWLEFTNKNKYGVYALALGFAPFDSIKTCSPAPEDYEAVFICRGLIPGIGVGAGESGRLECSMKAKAATEHDFCIIGFTPEFESTGAGLAKAMAALGMCEED